MNYDTQYAFSHGLASAPHFQTLPQQQQQLQRHQFQQQQVFPQQQYGQIAPTSNVFFQFTAGGNPVFQQKDIPQMAALATAGLQQTPLGAQHGMVTSPFVKQGVPVRMEGNCVHLVGGTEGMIYQHQPQQSDLKIITANPDTRMLQQHPQLDTGLGLSQNTAATILGLDMLGGQPQPLLDQGTLDMANRHHPQQQGITMPGQGGMLSYNKQQPFSSPWLQPQQHVNNPTGNLQHQQQQTQSALPSFTHLWSQFQQQKNQTSLTIQQPQQQAHMNTIQQSQPFQNQTSLQPSQQFAAASNFPALANMQMINMSQFQDQSQQQSPLPILPSQVACFSPCGPNSTPSPCSVDRHVSPPDNLRPSSSLSVQGKGSACQSTLSITDDALQQATPTLLTDSASVPPKVTVILDSLPHCETFPPTAHFQGNSETALKLGAASVIPCSYSLTSRNKHHNSASTPNGQLHFHQKKLGVSRPLKPISSTGSSMERSSSESSNFSSPPYAITPPNSNDSLFSPGAQVFHPDEHISSDSLLEENPTSVCLSSSSLLPTMSPSSISSSPLHNAAQPKTSETNLNIKLDGGKVQHPFHPHGNITTLTTVATALALSSPSTTTVITAMASSHQLVTTTTATTSVTLASQCLIDGSETTMLSGCITSKHSTPLGKPSKVVYTSNSGQIKSNSIIANTSMSSEKKRVKVPFSWHRKRLENGSIVYLSPSGAVLDSYEQICQYLLSDSTCKCGLECPIQVGEFFSFDPSFVSQPWTPDAEENQTKDKDRVDIGGKQREDLRKLCNHRRQVLALAALHSSQSHLKTGNNSLLAGKKRDRKKSASGGENLILSPLKRLKTSITNAVNRHAVTSGKKKPLKQMEESTDSSPYLNAQPVVSSAVLPAEGQGNQLSEELLSISPMGVSENEFSNFSSVNGVEIYSTLDDTLEHSEHKFPLFMNSSDEIVDCFPQQECAESPKKLSKDQDQKVSQISPIDAASPLTQNLSNDMELSDTKVSKTVGAPFPTSFSIWDSSPAQQTALQENFPKHSTPISDKSEFQTSPEPLKRSEQSPPNSGSSKNKARRQKYKREKQTLISNTPCSKHAASKINLDDDLPLPTSTVSFLENPTVFVAQQTVMINNSMASCKMAYSSPGPTVLSPSPTDEMIKFDEQKEKQSPLIQGKSVKLSEASEKEKSSTDINKSFSDVTENDDSAYLSQTGSDQERSDTIDGSDSNIEPHKVSDVYDFNCSEEQKAESGIVHVNMKGSERDASKDGNPQKLFKIETPVSSSNTVSGILQEKSLATKSKPKQRSSPQHNKKGSIQLKNGLEDPCKSESIGSLNKDLSDLLASDNWNIPAVQQVLAQYSGGDPGQLNAAIQQVLSQASSAGVVFPASNLLTAAAQSQVRAASSCKKPPLNGVILSGKSGSSVSKQQQPKESTLSLPFDQGAIKNVVNKSQQNSRDLAVNVAGSITKQEPQHNNSSPLKAVKPKSKSGSAVANSCTKSQNTKVPVRQQHNVEASPKSRVPTPSVSTSSAQVSTSNNPVLLNGFGSTSIAMKPQAVLPVSGMTTLVSKTTTGVGVRPNPTILGTASMPAPQLAQPHPIVTAQHQQQQQSIGNACIINATSQQLGKPAGNSGQSATIPTANPQQLMAPSGHQPTQLATPQAANTQLMNALSVQGLNPSQQLLLQQMSSPCNPVSQLSPAMAAQLLSQSQQQQQQMPQMSPSFLAGAHPQLQKLPQNSVLGGQTGIFASVPLPSFSATSATSNCSGLFTQANTCIPPAQSQPRAAEANLPALLNATVECTDQLAHGIPQVKDVATAVSLANASMFAAAATSQPVFVIPQANASPVVQVLGSTQSLATATDLNVQQQTNNLAAQLFGQQQSQQAGPFDPSQLQNLLSGGFNPLSLQQTINTLNLSGVHQQQQQLQMLQLQQLMLQQFQNQQNQSLQGISIPGPQAAPQAIVNAVMPTPNLQLSSMVDVNAIHPSLSPVAAAAATHQNLIGNPLPQTQLHITSSIGAQPVVQVSAPTTVSVVQNASIHKMQPSVVKTIPSVPSLIQAPAVTTAAGKHPVNTLVASQQDTFHQKQIPAGRTQPLALPTSTTTKLQPASISPVPSSTMTPTSPASSSSKSSTGSGKSSKSKPKSKKSETKKASDPEAERNEEDIAATVQQILAQAVQQQRELQLAAKNQPPPPPKSKSKKSQARSKANANSNHMAVGPLPPALPTPAAAKEHDLGKLPSIMSDDVVIHKPEQAVLSNSNCIAANLAGPSPLPQPSKPSTSSSDSLICTQPELRRPPQLDQNQPTTPILHPHQPQPTFLTPLGSVPPPSSPIASMAAAVARSAQSSQPARTEPLVTAPVPPKQYQLLYQGGPPPPPGKNPSPQVLHKNGAVETESNSQPNASSSVSNNNLPEDHSPNLAPGLANRKSAISLKDHLSSIISKDKDNCNKSKKVNGGLSSSRPSRTKDAEERKPAQVMSTSQQNSSVGPKVLRKSVK